MNAYMNISVRVLSANAQAQIKALQMQVRALEGELAKANAVSSRGGGILGGSGSRKTMMQFGNQIQWTGRQLQYNWTLPLALAAGAATKFALDNEKAFVHVKKVYGDTADAVDYFKKHQDQIPDGMNAVQAAASAQRNELAALGDAFEALSSRYGVAQKDILDTAGAWAAAGQSGVALARSTELSVKASILGDMDLAKATESLIAIQAQYSLSTKQLGVTLEEMNAIENQTGISMQGLIDGFARTAGVARESGIDVRHLGAMLAALVPATGSAATAGNSLKTIISRLMSPTEDATNVMAEFGVKTSDAAWQSSTAMERLQILADHMNNTLQKTGEGTKTTADNMYRLSDSQKQVVASVLGSRYQMNRFLVLMRELGPDQSYYEKALNATSNRQKVFAQATKELNAVLKSNPQRLKIIWTTLQNGMADAIQPMIPYFIYLAQLVADMVTKFNNLNPSTQKLFLLFAVGLAVVGPLIRYMGSLMTLIGAMSIPIKLLIGWWAKLITTEAIVDGATVKTKFSFLGLAGTMISLPFRAVSVGLGMIAGRIIGLGAALGISRAATAAWAAIQMAAAILLWTTWEGASNRVIGAWITMWLRIQAAHAAGWVLTIRTTVAGWASVIAQHAGAWFMIAGEWVSGWMTVAAVTVSGWARVLGSFIGAGRIASVMAPVTAAISGAWTAMYVGMANASATAGAVISGIHLTMFRGMLAAERLWAAASAAIATKGFFWSVIEGLVAFGASYDIIFAKFTGTAERLWAATFGRMAATQASAGGMLTGIQSAIYTRLLILQAAFDAQTTAASEFVEGKKTAIAARWAELRAAIQREWGLLGVRLELLYGSLQTKAAAAPAATMAAITSGIAAARLAIQEAFANTAIRIELLYGSLWVKAASAPGRAVAAITAAVATARLAIAEWFAQTAVRVELAYGALWTRAAAAPAAAITAITTAVSAARLAIMETFANTAVRLELAYGAMQTAVANRVGAVRVAIQNAVEAAVLGVQKAWQIVSINLQWAFWAAYAAVTTAGSKAIALIQAALGQAVILIQRGWQIASVNLAWAWSIGMQAATAAGAIAMRTIWLNLRMAMWVITSTMMSGMATRFAAGVAAMLAFATRWLSIKTILFNLRMALLVFSESILPILTGPWGIAIAAVIALLVKFHNQIATIWHNLVSYFSNSNNELVKGIVNAWNSLPQGITNALVAVVRVVKAAALQVYDWFSYLNPFAHHSPSLVENAQKGMAHVSNHLSKVQDTKGHFQDAHGAIENYGGALQDAGAAQRQAASAPAPSARRSGGGAPSGGSGGGALQNLIAAQNKAQQASDQAQIAKIDPKAAAEYGRLASQVNALTKQLNALGAAVKAQEAVVARWQKKLDDANAALDRQQKKLEDLQAVQQKWQDKLQSAQTTLQNFASAPIQGMQEMSDKIFANDQAQKKLRLEMMKMEQVGGMLDDIKGKIEAINGAQESLRGEQAALRSAGAGSEILGQYDDQIKALEKQKSANTDAAQSLQDMSNALDELQRKGDQLDLENSLKFDPLTRQIDQAANAMKELPFDQIMAGVQGAQSDISKYQQHLDAATAAVNRQQKAVDRATAARDRVQKQLDAEQKKLDGIKARYDAVNQRIQDMTQLMNDAAQAASALEQARKDKKDAKKGSKPYVTAAVKNFRDAAGGNFAKVGGEGIPIRTNWKDQSGKIKDFTKRISDEAAGAFADINPFGGIKDKWNQFKGWFHGVWQGLSKGVSDMLSHAFAGVGGGGGLQKAADGFRTAWAKVTDWFTKNVWNKLMGLWRLFGPSVKEFMHNAVNGFKEIWKQIGPELTGIGKEIMGLGPAFQGLWNFIKIYFFPIAARIVFLGKIIFSIAAKTIYPILQTIGNVIENLLQVVKGAIQIVSGFFMLFAPGHFTEGLKKMMAGIGNIFSGTFGAIGQLIRGAVKVVLMAVWGLVKGVWDFFYWLWDELVGHSIVPDMIDGIIKVFHLLADIVKFVWNEVVKPIWSLFKKMLSLVVGVMKLLWAGIKGAWNVLKGAGKWIWDNVLSPIVGFFKDIWSKWIAPLLRLWWAGIQLEWAILKGVATWLWNHVLKPIWDKVKEIWDKWVKPAFHLWWAGIKLEWAVLKGAAKWIWNHVLEPVWNKVKSLWDKYVGPGLKAWWGGLKREWGMLKAAGKWIWEHVLQPVWNKIQDLWNKVGPELRKWWGRIQNAWNAIKAAGKWVWDNVLHPVFQKIKDLWNDAHGELSKWWGRITSIWDKLKDLGGWLKSNVTDPIFNKITGVWNDIKDWFNSHKDMLLSPVQSIVGAVVKAVNTIIGGINKISDILPGVEWHVPEITWPPGHASGAMMQRRAGRGFKTNGARAIVGEGKANYPEFVIPTDPTHRRRATALMSQAANKMGLTGPGGDSSDIRRAARKHQPLDENGVPKFGVGGWLSSAWHGTKAAAGKVADISKKAISSVMNPALNYAEGKVKGIGWGPAEWPPLMAIDKLRDWTTEGTADLKDAVNKSGGGPDIQRGLKFAKSMVGTPYLMGGFSTKGIDCSGFMSAIANVVEGQSPWAGRGATSNFPWSGWKMGVAPGKGFTVGSTKNYGSSGVGHMAGTLGGVNVESHADAGVVVGNAARSYRDSGFDTHAYLPLKEGGIALARKGPIVAKVGDGRYDEAVVPLPKGFRDNLIGASAGGRTININGDLSFPNIKSGDDAKTFLDNLESLAKD